MEVDKGLTEEMRRMHPRVRKAIAFVHENLGSRTLDLKTIAVHAGLSRFHLCRVFAASTGESVARFIRRERLAAIKQRLESGGRIVDILPESGFADIPHLTRLFRQEFGLPPASYARQFSRSANKQIAPTPPQPFVRTIRVEEFAQT